METKEERLARLDRRLKALEQTSKFLLSLPPQDGKFDALIAVGFEQGWLESERLRAESGY
jgi:hypothetical protein